MKGMKRNEFVNPEAISRSFAKPVFAMGLLKRAYGLHS
jgi:hypothetical protein